MWYRYKYKYCNPSSISSAVIWVHINYMLLEQIQTALPVTAALSAMLTKVSLLQPCFCMYAPQFTHCLLWSISGYFGTSPLYSVCLMIHFIMIAFSPAVKYFTLSYISYCLLLISLGHLVFFFHVILYLCSDYLKLRLLIYRPNNNFKRSKCVYTGQIPTA